MDRNGQLSLINCVKTTGLHTNIQHHNGQDAIECVKINKDFKTWAYYFVYYSKAFPNLRQATI
jgi:hypothetical protein